MNFLIDANLPKRFRFWRDSPSEFLPDDEWPDHVIWRYARERNLIIVTKDGDFEKLALTEGPPVVVKLCVGDASRREIWEILARWWPAASQASQQPGCRLVRIYPDYLDVEPV